MFFFPSKGKRILTNLIHWNTEECTAYIKVESLLSVGMDANNTMWELRTMEWGRITMIFTAQRSLTNLHPPPLDFLTDKTGILQGLVQWT